MTLEDMLDAGVAIEGYVRVNEWAGDSECITHFEGHTNEQTNGKRFGDLLGMEVRYMYAIDDVTPSGDPRGCLVIEVGR